MPRIGTASDQNRYVDPFQQRIQTWDGTNDPKYYLSRTINSLLRSIGDDIVLDGLDVSVTFTEETVTATISPGLLIQDSTILELDEELTIELENANAYDPEGYFIVVCGYQYLSTPISNPFRFEITYVSPSGIPAHTPYRIEKNRTVIEILDFETNPETDDIIDVYQSYKEQLSIYGKQYYRHGHCKDNIRSEKLSKYMVDHVKIIDYNYTSECSDVVCVDTSNEIITISLPENPIRGDYITILDFKSTFGTNQVNIDRNGNLINGQEISLSIGTNDEWMRLRYTGDRRGWLVESPGAGGGSGYTLPPATITTLGGIIVGAGLSVDSSGVLSTVSGGIPPATTSTIGGVIIGSGISVDGSGIISADIQTDENFTSTEKIKLASIEESANNYILPQATESILGGIKVGSGLSIAGDGTLNVTISNITYIGDLSDVESTMGTAGQILMVNSTGDGLEYADIPEQIISALDCGSFT